MDILSQANEKFSRQYELKRLRYDLERVEQKVTEIYRIEREELYSRTRQKRRAEARSLLLLGGSRIRGKWGLLGGAVRDEPTRGSIMR